MTISVMYFNAAINGVKIRILEQGPIPQHPCVLRLDPE
jgi:hypothetical protein